MRGIGIEIIENIGSDLIRRVLDDKTGNGDINGGQQLIVINDRFISVLEIRKKNVRAVIRILIFSRMLTKFLECLQDSKIGV